MSDLRLAAEACGNLAKSYRSVMMVADAIAGIADLEQATAEATKAKVVAENGAEAARLVLAEVQQALADARTAVNQANQDAISVSRDATVKGQAIIDQAKYDAADAKAAADEYIAGLKVTADEVIAAHAANMTAFAADEADAQASVDALKAELAALKARLG